MSFLSNDWRRHTHASCCCCPCAVCGGCAVLCCAVLCCAVRQVLGVLKHMLAALGSNKQELSKSVLSLLVSLVVSGAADLALPMAEEWSRSAEPSLIRAFIQMVRVLRWGGVGWDGGGQDGDTGEVELRSARLRTDGV